MLQCYKRFFLEMSILSNEVRLLKMKNYAIRASASYFLKLPIDGNSRCYCPVDSVSQNGYCTHKFFFHEKTNNIVFIKGQLWKKINIFLKLCKQRFVMQRLQNPSLCSSTENSEEETKMKVVIKLFQLFFPILRESWFMWETLLNHVHRVPVYPNCLTNFNHS